MIGPPISSITSPRMLTAVSPDAPMTSPRMLTSSMLLLRPYSVKIMFRTVVVGGRSRSGRHPRSGKRLKHSLKEFDSTLHLEDPCFSMRLGGSGG